MMLRRSFLKLAALTVVAPALRWLPATRVEGGIDSLEKPERNSCKTCDLEDSYAKLKARVERKLWESHYKGYEDNIWAVPKGA